MLIFFRNNDPLTTILRINTIYINFWLFTLLISDDYLILLIMWFTLNISIWLNGLKWCINDYWWNILQFVYVISLFCYGFKHLVLLRLFKIFKFLGFWTFFYNSLVCIIFELLLIVYGWFYFKKIKFGVFALLYLLYLFYWLYFSYFW